MSKIKERKKNERIIDQILFSKKCLIFQKLSSLGKEFSKKKIGLIKVLAWKEITDEFLFLDLK